jgi:enoyl-CoA hydratase/carnithine racemase
MNDDNMLTAVHGDGVLRTGDITLNRPKQLNALNDA